jgi:hypothetical protein
MSTPQKILLFTIMSLSTYSYSGSCQVNPGVVQGGSFMVMNSTDGSLTIAEFPRNKRNPSTSKSLGSSSSYESSQSSIVKVCAYQDEQITSHVTQTTKLACCDSASGFIGSSLAFIDGNNINTYQGKVDTAAKLTDPDVSSGEKARTIGSSLGGLMGYN